MWYVIEVDGKIKDADLFGPFDTEPEAREFAKGREGDHAFTQAVDPRALKIQNDILRNPTVMRGEAVRLSVNGFGWTGVIINAGPDGIGVAVMIERDGDVQGVGIPLSARYEITRA